MGGDWGHLGRGTDRQSQACVTTRVFFSVKLKLPLLDLWLVTGRRLRAGHAYRYERGYIAGWSDASEIEWGAFDKAHPRARSDAASPFTGTGDHVAEPVAHRDAPQGLGGGFAESWNAEPSCRQES
jgi:hypothetical protein